MFNIDIDEEELAFNIISMVYNLIGYFFKYVFYFEFVL